MPLGGRLEKNQSDEKVAQEGSQEHCGKERRQWSLYHKWRGMKD